jgi:hypothetical protein
LPPHLTFQPVAQRVVLAPRAIAKLRNKNHLRSGNLVLSGQKSVFCSVQQNQSGTKEMMVRQRRRPGPSMIFVRLLSERKRNIWMAAAIFLSPSTPWPKEIQQKNFSAPRNLPRMGRGR